MHLSAPIWLIPALPLLAAGFGALTPREGRRFAARRCDRRHGRGTVPLVPCPARRPCGPSVHAYSNFGWFDLGAGAVRLGWLLDPLGALMCAMVSLVGLLIFVFSLGYMREDPTSRDSSVS